MSKYGNNDNQVILQGYCPRFGLIIGVRRTLIFDSLSKTVTIMNAKSGEIEQILLSGIAFLKNDSSFLANGKLMKSLTIAVDVRKKVRFAFKMKSQEQEYIKFLDLLTKSINAERRLRYRRQIYRGICPILECVFYINEQHKTSRATRYWWFINNFWFAPIMFVAIVSIFIVLLQLFIIYQPELYENFETAFVNFVWKLFGLSDNL